MMTKLKIKNRLILYSFLIQLIILSTFSFAIYKIYEDSTIENIENNLDMILLDIYHDLTEEKIRSLEENRSLIEEDMFDEDEEFNFRPLELRLSKITNTEIKILKSTNFPKNFTPNIQEVSKLEIEAPLNKVKDGYIYEIVKVKVKNDTLLLEAITTQKYLNYVIKELIYILLIVVPFVLIIASLGNYFLIYKSFKPINEILANLKKIKASSLSKRLERNHNKDEVDQLKEEINNLLSRLETSFEKISQFSTNASHELKTPLTIIRGEIELALRKDRTQKEYKETLKTCQNEVLTIQQTVDHLLFLSKSKDHLEKNIKEIYLDELTIECIKELRNYAKLKNIYLDSKIKEAISIEGNRELLKIAIKNIIKNAITFSFENRTVKIDNYSDENFNIISVEDKGIGIKKEEQEKIFEEFYRTDKSRNKESGGTGLGLSICKKIISLHNAIIELESEENKGTKIKFKFKK